eukprot:m.277351 g.277351  ORF g.277351 m.277351 type:complete len:193 (+) comp16306_c0_seq2:295-873(+)
MGKEDFLQAAVVLYAFTGWLQPLLVDALRLSGGIEIGLGPSLLPNLANTLGMACVPLSERMLVYMAKACNFKSALEGFEGDSFTDPFLSLDTLKQAPKPKEHVCGHMNLLQPQYPYRRELLRITAVDFASGALLLLGQLRTGANVFVVLYSSCTAFTRVFSFSHGQAIGFTAVGALCFWYLQVLQLMLLCLW